MVKKLVLLPFILTLPAATLAQTSLICSSVTSCLQESYRQNRPRLPYFIHEKSLSCSTYQQSPQKKSEFEKCQQEIIMFSQSALTCQDDPQRLVEAEKYDKKLLQYLITDNGGEVAIPERIQQAFAELTQAAEKNFVFSMKKPVWSLRAYGSKIPNAHAGASGDILISNYFWNPKANFSIDEIAGILGHEIGHVIHRDSLRLGCLAHEWVGSDLPLNIEELTSIFREDISPTIPRGKQWSQLSQSLELNADIISKSLLVFAGKDPALMAQALRKLQAIVSEGTSGSHPGFELRVNNLNKDVVK